eukprot:363668-Chlamydomonas_euryale.AAC.4
MRRDRARRHAAPRMHRMRAWSTAGGGAHGRCVQGEHTKRKCGAKMVMQRAVDVFRGHTNNASVERGWWSSARSLRAWDAQTTQAWSEDRGEARGRCACGTHMRRADGYAAARRLSCERLEMKSVENQGIVM